MFATLAYNSINCKVYINGYSLIEMRVLKIYKTYASTVLSNK